MIPVHERDSAQIESAQAIIKARHKAFGHVIGAVRHVSRADLGLCPRGFSHRAQPGRADCCFDSKPHPEQV